MHSLVLIMSKLVYLKLTVSERQNCNLTLIILTKNVELLEQRIERWFPGPGGSAELVVKDYKLSLLSD